MRFYLVFLTYLNLIANIHCHDASKALKTLDANFLHYEYSQYAVLLVGMLLILLIRYVLKVFEFRISYAVFAIAIGVVWGVLAMYFEELESSTKIFDTVMSSAEDIYIPLVIFGTAFCIDVHAFIKSLPQVLIISIPLFLLNGFMYGSFTSFVVGNEWTLKDGIFFGMMTNAIYPLEILHLFKETNQTKQVIVLLEGETIITTVVCVYSFYVMKYSFQGFIKYWYQFVMGVVRLFFLNVPLSYIFGSAASFLLRIGYNDSLHLSIISIVTCFSSYVFTVALTFPGTLGCLLTGIMMGIERTSLPSEVEKSIIEMWKVIISLLNQMIFLIIGGMTPELLKSKDFYVYALVIVTYLISNISRFICFFLFSPILSRIGYGMTFKSMVVCVWSGLKHPLSLSLTGEVKSLNAGNLEKFQLFYIHGVLIYLLYLFINATFLSIILKALGLTELSVAKELNMNNCVKYILQGRERTIAILKMDRFLSDANWPLVVSTTAFKHPYKKKNTQIKESESDDEEDLFLSNRFSVCPDCKKRVPNEPTPKELKDMTKEAKVRLLKLRKIFYSRAYENGMLTKDGARMAHQSVEVALETEQKQIEIDGLIKMFNRESASYRFLQKRFMNLFKMNTTSLKAPKRFLRRAFYRMKDHLAFIICLNLIHLSNVILAIYDLSRNPPYYSKELLIVNGLNMTVVILLMICVLVKILGWSSVRIIDGIRKYFSSFWSIFCFTIICCLHVELINFWTARYLKDFGKSTAHVTIRYCTNGIRLIGFISFLQLFQYYKKFGTNLIKFLDMKIAQFRTMAFELGNNFISGEEELIENIAVVVDNDKIRESLKIKIQEDKLSVTRAFGLAQKDKPWVAVTVKTKLGITTVLKSMNDDLQKLKMSGWVDDIEYSKLNKSLAERYRYVNSIMSVEPPTPTLIFKEIGWMGQEENIVNYLYENAVTKKFDPGDIICNEGEIIEGIYIVISGIFLLTYFPQKSVVNKLNEAGILPITDYISPTNFEEKTEEYIIPGNTIGELSMLTDRPYNCIITAETHSQVYVLRRETIKQAMELDPDPVNGLECRLWKFLAFRLAMPVLINAAPYRSYKTENLKYIIHRSFVPNISNYKVFLVNEMMEDLILIEGVAVDLHTRDVYTGPCYIQRSVQKLILPKSSTLNMDVEVETKLMVVPAKEFDEYEIMLQEEKTCELVSLSSTRCLQHLVKDRLAKTKVSRQRRKIRALAKPSGKKADIKGEVSKSRITFEPKESGNN